MLVENSAKTARVRSKPGISPGHERHIVFLLSHGFAARMMIRTGMARRLVGERARVTVISANADESYFQKECEEQGIALEQAPKVAGRIAHWFRNYRPYLLDNVMGNPSLKRNHDDRFKNHRAYGLAMELVNRTLAPRSSFRRISRALECRINGSKEVKQLLARLKPDLLVLPNPFGVAETLYLLHAKEQRIPVVCQMLSWDNITSKGTPLLMPDYFISWGPIMTEEIVNLYDFPRDKIYECGVSHFDIYRQKNQLISRDALLQQFNLPTTQPSIFYGMVAEMYCPNELEILAWLVNQVNKSGFAKPCSLIIRPHPLTISGIYAGKGKGLEALQSLAGPRVALDIPPVLSDKLAWDLPKSDMCRLASLLAGCAMCINANSTLCLDACMSDRPVINIAFDGLEDLPYEISTRQCLDYIHMAKLLRFRGVRIARSFNELERHINAYLRDPTLDHKERILTATAECGPRDGRAAERVATTLLKLSHQTGGANSSRRLSYF